MKILYSVEDISNIIDSEGLDYAVQHYVDPANIVDPQLGELWVQAQVALHALQQYISNNSTVAFK